MEFGGEGFQEGIIFVSIKKKWRLRRYETKKIKPRNKSYAWKKKTQTNRRNGGTEKDKAFGKDRQ